MIRTIIAGIVGGVVMFLWSFVSHVTLPIGEIGVKSLPNDTVVMSELRSNINEPGLYIYPGMNMENTTEAEMAAWTDKYKAGPRGILVYSPTGDEPMGAKM